MQDRDSGSLTLSARSAGSDARRKWRSVRSQNCFDFRPSGDTVSADNPKPIGLPGDTKQ